MPDDKNTIGLTHSGRSVMDQIWEKAFKDRMDAAKFAMSLAISSGVEKSSLKEASDTTWNIGSFDPEGELKNLVLSLYPDVTTPYRFIECLIDEGLKIIKKHLEKNKELVLTDLMSANQVK